MDVCQLFSYFCLPFFTVDCQQGIQIYPFKSWLYLICKYQIQKHHITFWRSGQVDLTHIYRLINPSAPAAELTRTQRFIMWLMLFVLFGLMMSSLPIMPGRVSASRQHTPPADAGVRLCSNTCGLRTLQTAFNHRHCWSSESDEEKTEGDVILLQSSVSLKAFSYRKLTKYHGVFSSGFLRLWFPCIVMQRGLF